MTQLSNQFAMTPELGTLDLAFNGQTIAAQIDASELGSLLPGQSVKLVDSVGGVPKVIACADDADVIFGFINYDLKSKSFVAGSAVQLSSMNGNVMYLKATAAIARGALVKGVVATVGGVATAVPGSGSPICGWAFDKAVNVGDLIRVVINAPSFFVA